MPDKSVCFAVGKKFYADKIRISLAEVVKAT
jgi:hypothetical protein